MPPGGGRGTERCYAGAKALARHGADDPADPIDDNGVDFVVAKHGADDPAVPCDDHGTDDCLSRT